MVATVCGIVREEGAMKLWQGVTPALYRHVVYRYLYLEMHFKHFLVACDLSFRLKNLLLSVYLPFSVVFELQFTIE